MILIFLTLVLASDASCAPTEIIEETITESVLQNDTISGRAVAEENKEKDSPQSNEKNPVQEWFENLSKNASTNAQNAMNTFQEWLNKVSQSSNNGIVQNVPTMYMGSFQLLKMPMPQFGDVIKGMGDLATMAQSFNKVTGGLGQNLPLISQG